MNHAACQGHTRTSQSPWLRLWVCPDINSFFQIQNNLSSGPGWCSCPMSRRLTMAKFYQFKPYKQLICASRAPNCKWAQGIDNAFTIFLFNRHHYLGHGGKIRTAHQRDRFIAIYSTNLSFLYWYISRNFAEFRRYWGIETGSWSQQSQTYNCDLFHSRYLSLIIVIIQQYR